MTARCIKVRRPHLRPFSMHMLDGLFIHAYIWMWITLFYKVGDSVIYLYSCGIKWVIVIAGHHAPKKRSMQHYAYWRIQAHARSQEETLTAGEIPQRDGEEGSHNQRARQLPVCLPRQGVGENFPEIERITVWSSGFERLWEIYVFRRD